MSVYCEQAIGMIFYTVSCLIGLAWFVAIVSQQTPTKIQFGINQSIRRAWLIAAWQAPEYIIYWEDKFKCCGYKNVFDYCCADQMSTIIPTYYLEYNMFLIEMEQRKAKTTRKVSPFNWEEPVMRDDFNESEYTIENVDVPFSEYDYGSYGYESSESNSSFDHESVLQERTLPLKATAQPVTKTTKDCTNLNEQCVCDRVEEEGLLNIFTYTSMTCKFNLTDGTPIMVKDSCPARNAKGADICHLDGCADHIRDYFSATWIYTCVFTLCIIYLCIYTISVYFTTQLTYHFIRDALKLDTDGNVDEADHCDSMPKKPAPHRTKLRTLALLAAHDKQRLSRVKTNIGKQVRMVKSTSEAESHEAVLGYTGQPSLDLTESQVRTTNH